MKVASFAILIALAAGLAAGVMLERRRAPAVAEIARPAAGVPGSADATADEPGTGGSRDFEAELRKAKERIRELKAEIAELKGSGPGGMDEKSAKARAKELRALIPGLVEKGDGATLMSLMKELAALGPEGYRGAMEIAEIFKKEFGNGEEAYGIQKILFNKAWSGTMVPLMTWALSNPGDASPWFRAKSAQMLYWVSDVDPTPIFLNALASEKDPGIAQALAGFLEHLAKPEMVDGIEKAILAHGDRAQTFQPLVQALVDLHTPESGAALRELARSASPALAASLELAIVEHSPPASGIIITSMKSKSQAETVGLQRGDIIVSYDGRDVKSLDQLRKAVQTKPDKELVPVMVNRGGTLVPVQLTGDWIGIDGKYVKP